MRRVQTPCGPDAARTAPTADQVNERTKLTAGPKDRRRSLPEKFPSGPFLAARPPNSPEQKECRFRRPQIPRNSMHSEGAMLPKNLTPRTRLPKARPSNLKRNGPSILAHYPHPIPLGRLHQNPPHRRTPNQTRQNPPPPKPPPPTKSKPPRRR